MKNSVEIKEFLGMEVRVVNHDWLVLKDMFSALGRVKKDGGWNDEKKKLDEFLELIDRKEHSESFGVLLKQGRSKVYKEVECIKLETVPVVLTQFKPTTRKGEEALRCWADFMKFVNKLLVENEAYNYIVNDVDLEKQHRDKLKSYGGNPVVLASMTSYAMGVILTGDKVKITKDDLKIYKDKTTIDLIECRRFFIEEFVRAYRIIKSHREANKIALEYTLENFELQQESLLEVA
ncbi:hypothetical protein [Clostridium perfringens]|uniref:hypothetical protein n=1 Tax=Clostridium perfringens TaxID=1502 RepID=UPI0013E32953|nr:hypothetical protein [Clostridium perfringens]NGU14610.1 hypothetical protein [Clostridium perfringens]NGY67385.1 hypothetical protein [Clostridium perfringens]